jgi:transcriptional regulator GlxA family with amidase domain
MNYHPEFSYDSDGNERSTVSHGALRMDMPFPQLVAELYAVLRGPHTAPEERIRQAEAILSAFPRLQSEDDRRLDRAENGCVERGGLAPWQIRRVKEYVEQGLAERLTGADLAKRVKLSEHHFCRAFRISLRQTPHTYVIARRVERARHMMMSCERTIGQIAIECGFSDQAHFNRCFRKLIGTSPGAWRRAITAKASA